jgi:hypothetical protein
LAGGQANGKGRGVPLRAQRTQGTRTVVGAARPHPGIPQAREEKETSFVQPDSDRPATLRTVLARAPRQQGEGHGCGRRLGNAASPKRGASRQDRKIPAGVIRLSTFTFLREKEGKQKATPPALATRMVATLLPGPPSLASPPPAFEPLQIFSCFLRPENGGQRAVDSANVAREVHLAPTLPTLDPAMPALGVEPFPKLQEIRDVGSDYGAGRREELACLGCCSCATLLKSAGRHVQRFVILRLVVDLNRGLCRHSRIIGTVGFALPDD